MSYARATLRLPGHGPVHLIGTCHLSPDSPVEVCHTITQLRPAAVMLELCADRAVDVLSYSRLPPPLPELTLGYAREHWRALVDPLFWFRLPLLGAEALIGTREGWEFTAAARAAGQVGAQVVLIDRPASATLTRIVASLRQLSLGEVAALASAGTGGDTAADTQEIVRLVGNGGVGLEDDAQLERARMLAQRVVRTLDPHRAELEFPPAVRTAILDERDILMGACAR
jgi:pheromone shutdown protein TraB